MKKKIFLLSVSMFVVLASCSDRRAFSSTGPSESTPLTENTSPSTSTDSSSVDELRQSIVDNLKKLSQGNYTLSYKYGTSDHEDKVTPNYNAFLNYGNILLPSYNDPSKKQAFSYTIENGQIHLQTGLVSDDNIPYDSLEQFDGMTLLKNATPEDYASIEESANVFGYRTTNNLITQAFSILMGLENDWYSGAIAGVDFLYFTEEELEFQLIKHDETGSSYVNVENGNGTFTEIGTTIDPVLEDYISTFSYPSKNLGDQVSNIVQDNLSTSSVLKMVSIQTGQVLSQRSTAVDYDANNLQMLFTDPSSLTENVFVKNVDGKAHRVFIDAQTYQLTEEEVAPTWKELGWVKDSFDFAAFKLSKTRVATPTPIMGAWQTRSSTTSPRSTSIPRSTL